MKLKILFGLVISIFSLTIVGCGGGGGGSSAPPITTISGEASKGPIIGANVQIFKINADGSTTPLPTIDGKQVTTRLPFGNYSAVVSYAGPVKVVVTGNPDSYYMDEATTPATPDPNFPLKGKVLFNGFTLNALVANVSGSTKVAVTPYTDLAVRKAGTDLSASNINKVNTAVADAMGLHGVDIVATSPSKNEQYKFALGVVSQAAGATQTGLQALLTTTAAAIDVPSGSITDPALISKISDATSAAYQNKNINEHPEVGIPGIDPNKPQTITLTADPLQGVTQRNGQSNGPVTLSAKVTRLAGGPVPDTTPVTFTITSGPGTLTEITTTTNGTGIATAKLDSADVGTIIVTAKAGTITSSPVSVDFIFQPKTATLKLSTSGTFPAGITKITSLIGSLSIIPAGVTVKTVPNAITKVNNVDPAVLTLTGAAAALTTSGVTSAILLPAEVTAGSPATVGSPATTTKVLVPLVSFPLAGINASGFGFGEFVTIATDVVPGTFPKRTDFILSGFQAFGLDESTTPPTQVLLPNVKVDFTLSLQ